MEQPNMPKSASKGFQFYIVRQYRMQPSLECDDQVRILPSHIASKFRKTGCPQRYRESDLQFDVFPATLPSIPAGFTFNVPPYFTNEGNVSQKPANWSQNVKSIALDGVVDYYSAADKAYTLYFPLNDSRVYQEFEALRQLEWIDAHTRLLSVESLEYYPASGMYFFVALVMEITPSNVWVSSYVPSRFMLLVLPDSWVLCAFHIMMSLYLVYDTFATVKTAFINRVMVNGSVFLVWLKILLLHTLQISFCYFLVTALVLRAQLWFQSSDLSDINYLSSSEKALAPDYRYRIIWNGLTTYSAIFKEAQMTMAVALCISFLRLFEFLQYNSRLGILSETLVAAVSDLFTILLILSVIIAAFMFGGNLLYYTYRPFSSTTRSLSWLLLAATSGSVDDSYEQMREMHSVLTPIFVALFLTAVLLVILNMIISIITDAFQMVQDSISKPRTWSPAVIWRDIVKFLSSFVEKILGRWAKLTGNLVLKLTTWAGGDENQERKDPSQVEKKNEVKSKVKKDSSYLAKQYKIYGILKSILRHKYRGGRLTEEGRRVTIAKEALIEGLKKSGIPMTNDEVTTLYEKASREIRATAVSVKISDNDAKTIADDLEDKTRDFDAAVMKFRKRLSSLDEHEGGEQFLVSLITTFDIFTQIRNDAVSNDEKLEDIRTRADNLKSVLHSADDLNEAITQMIHHQEELKNTHRASWSDTLAQTQLLHRVSRSIVQKCDATVKSLRKKINTGTKYGIPTSFIRQEDPIQLSEDVGKGAISSVQKHGYLRQMDDKTADGMEVVAIADGPKTEPANNEPTSEEPITKKASKKKDKKQKSEKKAKHSDKK
eukprot:TRINITY_DN18895_c0_g1_i1.p1 TRINITY_DN18895_c0_g1~~TRINITY_DN18895_c0_g1_i1.p1  ORF type:complete len:940 (+),score=132.40 TRINITY_DN18895_c0_g1_i1:333-2822(+)